MSNFNKVEEILNYIQEKVIEILIDEYKFDFEKANDIFNQSTLNKIMKNKKRHRHVLHYSPGYWAIDVYEEYVKFLGLSNN